MISIAFNLLSPRDHSSSVSRGAPYLPWKEGLSGNTYFGGSPGPQHTLVSCFDPKAEKASKCHSYNVMRSGGLVCGTIESALTLTWPGLLRPSLFPSRSRSQHRGHHGGKSGEVVAPDLPGCMCHLAMDRYIYRHLWHAIVLPVESP